jgi:hypothetical protein
MRKLKEQEMILANGGDINWGDFASGFCDGLVLGEMLTFQFRMAGIVATACNLNGIGGNISKFVAYHSK